MIRSYASRILVGVAVAIVTIAAIAMAQSGRSALNRAQRAIENADFERAASLLEDAVDSSDEDVRLEAMFTLAGIRSDAAEATRLYDRIVDAEPRSEWAARARVELGKIRYATGDYQGAFRILHDGEACDVSDDECLFEGLSAIMLERFDDAARALGDVRRGKSRAWAMLSLAEVDAGQGRGADACRRYEALARSRINPAALYRYGECLENRGDVSHALEMFEEIESVFAGTPEAVLAAEKRQRIGGKIVAVPEKPAPETTADHDEGSEVLERGYTIQFGSFRDRGNAIKLATKIREVFPGVRIDSELVRYREYHRVRFGYYHTREEAAAMGERIGRELNEDYTIMTLP